MPAVAVDRASLAERPLIEGLFQFYMYDFSELEPSSSSDFEPRADGRFLSHVDAYWRDPDCIPLLIRAHGRMAGFALLDAASHRGRPLDHNMGEFFIMRKHRRAGVGAAAVRAILGGYPGRWEVAVVARNTAARAFWPRAIGAARAVSDLATDDRDDSDWKGPILSFRAGAP